MAVKDNNLLFVIVLIIILFLIGFNSGWFSSEQENIINETEEIISPCEELPDFTGTPREGEMCEDTLDCENHNPIGYTAGPLECLPNGKCQFEC
jgi:hypothetical protein